MLKQGALSQVKNEEFPRDKSHIVIAMRFYPRFLRKELRDEFICELAPEKQLLHEFNAAQKSLHDHNSAFAHVDYNRRFQLSDRAIAHLERLSKMSEDCDVYLVCICQQGDRCHREILMLLAKEIFGCKIGKVYHDYPEFMEKVDDIKKLVKSADSVKS